MNVVSPLRERVLAAVAAQPSLTRRHGRRLAATGLALSALVAVGFAAIIERFGLSPPVPIVERGRVALGWSLAASALTALVHGNARSTIVQSPRLLSAATWAAPVVLLTWLARFPHDDAPPSTDLLPAMATIILGAGPLMTYMAVRRGAEPSRPETLGAAAGAMCGAWAQVLVLLRCPPWPLSHAVVAHALPLTLMAALGAGLGRQRLASAPLGSRASARRRLSTRVAPFEKRLVDALKQRFVAWRNVIILLLAIAALTSCAASLPRGQPDVGPGETSLRVSAAVDPRFRCPTGARSDARSGERSSCSSTSRRTIGMRRSVIWALGATAAMGAGACSSNGGGQAANTGSGVSSAGNSRGSGAQSQGSSGRGSSSGSGASVTHMGSSSGSGASSSHGSSSSNASSSVSASSSGRGVDSGVPSSCKPDCTAKTCGDDGCGGTCGGCPPSRLCGSASTCVASPSQSSIVVDAKSQGTAISSGIYGIALNSDDSMQVASLNRWGGDATEAYNWQNDAYNSGADWYCVNYTWSFKSPNPDPSFTSATDQFVHYDQSVKADTLMTIPITGWIASMPTPYAAEMAHPDCAGASGGTATDQAKCCAELGTTYDMQVDKGSSVLDTSFMGNWVKHLVSTFGTAASGGVKYYQLDNEPDNWQGLRRDIYAALYPPGTNCQPFYATNASIGKTLNQDFIDRTMAYAKAVKQADPTSQVLFMSTENAWDLVAIPNNECGNPPGPYTVDNSLTQAILKLAAAEEQSTGQRVLDCVDMHYPFPGNGLGDAKALWDPTVVQYGATVVPPHVQGWINGTYPGTGKCVSEYNVPKDGSDGNTPDPSTAAQLADILGMYGRLGYEAAAYWGSFAHNGTHLPIYNAAAMYRNYDGAGGRFGAYSIGAASPNAGVDVYASSDSPTNPTKLWVMLVNVSGADQSNLSVSFQNFTASGNAAVYRADATHAPTASAAATVTGGSITGFSLPSNAIALLVMSR